MLKFIGVLLAFFSLVEPSFGQSNTAASAAKFIASDGLYANFNDLKRNKPTVLFSQLPKIEYYLNEEAGSLSLEIKEKMVVSAVNFSNFWGLVYQGKVYRATKRTSSDTLVVFMKLQFFGAISYYQHTFEESVSVPMKIHHPVFKVYVGERSVINKSFRLEHILINFNTGVEVPYSRQAFLGLIADDKPLLQSFKELSVEEAEQKWYKTAQIYNDRHPLSISKN